MKLPSSIQNLIDEFSKLPTIGRKSAERFVLYLLKKNQNDLDKFADAIKNLKTGIKKCEICGCLDENTPCSICSDLKRDQEKICVVATTRDLIIIENTGAHNGLYHVLGGNIDAIKEVNPEHLNIKKLLERVEKNNIKEIILALNPNFEGETTVLYLTKTLKDHSINPAYTDGGVKITRLARGLPTGADLQYADELTIKNALKYRT